MKQKLLILGAVVFGLLAAFLTHNLIRQERMKIMGSTEKVGILVAQRIIPAMETIKEGDFLPTKVERFKGDLRAAKEVSDTQLQKMLGRKVKYAINKGAPLSWSDLESDYEMGGGFSRQIEDTWRAISIPVSATSSISNMIQARDRVDVIGTFKFPDLKGDQMLDTVTVTFLQNVLVLATGRDYGQASGNTRTTSSYNTITLQVSPSEAEMLIFAMQKGNLTFTLRSPSDSRAVKNFNNVNWDFFLKNIQNYAKEREQRTRGRF